MVIPNIEWKEPWRAIQFAAEIPGVQKQVDREITTKHPLSGKGAIAIGRRIDNDDVLERAVTARCLVIGQNDGLANQTGQPGLAHHAGSVAQA